MINLWTIFTNNLWYKFSLFNNYISSRVIWLFFENVCYLQYWICNNCNSPGTWTNSRLKLTSSVTTLTLTLSLLPQMVLWLPLPVRTVKLCCGTLLPRSQCTPCLLVTKFTLCPSLQTDTGCVLPLPLVSRSSPWTHNVYWMTWSQNSLVTLNPLNHMLFPWLGLLTVKLCSLVTLTTSSEFGKSWPLTKFE